MNNKDGKIELKQVTSFEQVTIGDAVQIEQIYYAGQYAGARKIESDEVSIHTGIIVDINPRGSGTIKVKLKRGHLVDNPNYVHEHVWHIIDNEQFSTFLFKSNKGEME